MNVLIINGSEKKLDLSDVADDLGIKIVHNELDDAEVAIFDCIKVTPAAIDTAEQIWLIGECGAAANVNIKLDDVTPDTIMEITDMLIDLFEDQFDAPVEEE